MLQGRQGDGDDGRVQLAHERADADRGHGEPVGVAAFPYGFGPPGLDQQPVPQTLRHGVGEPPQVTRALDLMSRDDVPTSTS